MSRCIGLPHTGAAGAAASVLAAAVVCTAVGMAGCAERPEQFVNYFDPPTGTAINDVQASVTIMELDSEPLICFTIDGTEVAWNDGECANRLTDSRTIALQCGFNVVNIAWADGSKTASANFQVDHEECEASAGPVVLWANDELVRAAVAIKDEMQCRMNGCENPSSTGNWSADCDGGTVAWDVSLSGARAISTFTYNNCQGTAVVDVHDYEADPDWLDENATIQREITIVFDGVFSQDTDFSGNGNEVGSVTISGDFTGVFESRIQIIDKARGAGGFLAGCSADPLDDEVCAPGGAMILYDFPDWTCHGGICPEPGDEPPTGPDGDEDGVPDAMDNCPEHVNPLQEDIDEDGIGDACDDDPGFVVMQVKNGERCLDVGPDTVESNSACDAMDPSQQWLMFDIGNGYKGFRNVENQQCMSQSGSLIGPWDVVTETCDDNSDKQMWALEIYDQGGFDEQWPVRMRNQGNNFCLYTDFTGWVYGTAGNCGLLGTDAGRKVGIYYGGDFASEAFVP